MSIKKITSISDFTFHQKKRIIFCCMKYHEPVDKVAYNMGVAPKLVSDYLSFLMSDTEEMNKMLPAYLHEKQRIKYRTFEPVTYYSHLSGREQEMTIASDWKPTYDPTNIDHERPAPVFGDSLSFHEIITKDIYKIGKKLNAIPPVIAQSKINTKVWQKK